MNHGRDEPSHEAVVDAWLARSVDHDSSVEIVRLFHAALDAVWNRAVTILGPVTTHRDRRARASQRHRATPVPVRDRSKVEQ